MNVRMRTLGLVRKACVTFVFTVALSAGVTADTAHDAVAAPSFSLPVIANGEGELQLDSLRGSVVYLDFWASWCGPCRLSLPALDTLYRDLAPQGLIVAAISVDVVEEDALDFLERYPVTYPVAMDKTGAVPRSFSVNGMPSGYLIDRQGRVRAVHVGFKRGDEVALRDEIETLLSE